MTQTVEMRIVVDVPDADAAYEAALFYYAQLGRGDLEANAYMPEGRPLDLPHAILEATLAWLAETDLRLVETEADEVAPGEGVTNREASRLAVLRTAQEALHQLPEAEGDLGWNPDYWNAGGAGYQTLEAIAAALAGASGAPQARPSPQKSAPAGVFPVRNAATGNPVWFQVTPSAYGLSVIVHQQRPDLERSPLSPQTTMATVHVEYFGGMDAASTEQITVYLWDEHAGEEPGWDVPPEYDPRNPRTRQAASIVLVADVQQWRPPQSV